MLDQAERLAVAIAQNQRFPADPHNEVALLRAGGIEAALQLPRLGIAAEPAPRQEETAPWDEIQRLSLAHRHYGIRRIMVLLNDTPWQVNHKRVERIRQEDHLLCLPRRSFVPATTDWRHKYPPYANLVRGVVPMTVNQLWVADITYVRPQERFVYLAVVLDAFSRPAIGWHRDWHRQESLALAALKMTLTTRDVVPGGLIHHLDRGVRYACRESVDCLTAAGLSRA